MARPSHRQAPAAHASAEASSRKGTQSLERAFAVLRAVADAGPEGIRLSDIAAVTGLHVATTHRLLGGLERERAVSFDPYARVYHVGYDFLRREEESRDLRIRAHFDDMVRRLAELTGELVLLYTRHGLNALCIECALGQTPAPPGMLSAGGRRPLGVGAGTLVLLAALPAKELAATLDANEARYDRYDIGIRQLRAMLRDYRREGYAFHPGYVMRGVCGVGLPLCSDGGQVVAAVSLSVASERLTPQRLPKMVRTMRAEIARAGPFTPA